MINLFRLDNKSYYGVFGGKAQLANLFCANAKGIVTCGSRHSVQVLTFAQLCDILCIPCVVHVPKGKETDMTIELEKLSCTIVYENVGYNNVLNSHAKSNAEALGYTFVQLGMLCDIAFNEIAKNCAQLLNEFPDTKRIVVPVGSGTTLIGVLYGLQALNLDIPVLGVMVGMDATKNVDKFMSEPYKELYIVQSSLKYDKPYENNVVNSVELNPYYEAKTIPFLEDGDTLYVVAK